MSKRIMDLTRITTSYSKYAYAVFNEDTGEDCQIEHDDLAPSISKTNNNANNSSAILTNKIINSVDNTIINIVNADIKDSAGIDCRKLGTSEVTNTEFNCINGATSNIQAQLVALGASIDNVTTFLTHLEVTSDSSREIIITERDIQEALGVVVNYEHAIEFYSIQIQIYKVTGTILDILEEQTSVVREARTDNSRVHLKDITITTVSSTTNYIVSISCKLINASTPGV